MTDFATFGRVLYERAMPAGPLIRIRRTTDDGCVPVVGVLEIERRATSPRASRGAGVPPYLLKVEGASEQEVLTALSPFAENDATVSRLMLEHGLR